MALLAILFLATGAERKADLILALSRESTVLVHGKTNVNKFCCQGQPLESLGPMIADVRPQNGRVLFEGRGFRIRTGNLDCGNRMMNKDLNATLKAENHPYIRFVLLSLDFQPRMEVADGVCQIRLDVSGVERVMRANFEYVLYDDALYICDHVMYI